MMLDSVVVVVKVVVVWWWWCSLGTSVERSCWSVLARWMDGVKKSERNGWMEDCSTKRIWWWVVSMNIYKRCGHNPKCECWCFLWGQTMQREMGFPGSTKSFVQAVPRDSSRQYLHIHICRSIFTFEYRSAPRTTPLKLLLNSFRL